MTHSCIVVVLFVFTLHTSVHSLSCFPPICKDNKKNSLPICVHQCDKYGYKFGSNRPVGQQVYGQEVACEEETEILAPFTATVEFFKPYKGNHGCLDSALRLIGQHQYENYTLEILHIKVLMYSGKVSPGTPIGTAIKLACAKAFKTPVVLGQNSVTVKLYHHGKVVNPEFLLSDNCTGRCFSQVCQSNVQNKITSSYNGGIIGLTCPKTTNGYLPKIYAPINIDYIGVFKQYADYRLDNGSAIIMERTPLERCRNYGIVIEGREAHYNYTMFIYNVQLTLENHWEVNRYHKQKNTTTMEKSGFTRIDVGDVIGERLNCAGDTDVNEIFLVTRIDGRVFDLSNLFNSPNCNHNCDGQRLCDKNNK